MKNNNSDFKTFLKEIIDTQPSTLLFEVAEEALEYHDLKSFFEDLFQHGCSSGMVGRLIYYSDTHKFFDTYYNEIESLLSDFEESTGQSALQYAKGNLKNWLAWFAFEETARNIYYQFNY